MRRTGTLVRLLVLAGLAALASLTAASSGTAAQQAGDDAAASEAPESAPAGGHPVLRRIADRYVRNLDMLLIYRLDRFGRGGHHTPFNDVGFPAVRIMEAHEDYRRQHQDVRVEDGVEYGDVLEEVEFDFAAKLTGLNAATLASLAWAPPPPTGVENIVIDNFVFGVASVSEEGFESPVVFPGPLGSYVPVSWQERGD